MLVEAVEPRRHLMSAVFIEGQQYLVDTQTLLQHHIQAGSELDEEALEQLLQESRRRRAQEKALWLLSYREHSKAELTRKIAAKTDWEAAQGAAQRMEELGLVDDLRYARLYAQSLFEKKHFSRKRAAYEMSCKGLSKEIIEQVLEEVHPDHDQLLDEIIQKKYTPLPNEEKGRRRMTAALARLGYSYEEIRSALRRAAENQMQQEFEVD